MKLVTLNTWGGRVAEPLRNFFKQNSDKVDIFCLQEVFHDPSKTYENTKGVPVDWQSNLFLDTQQHLKGYNGFFRPFVLNSFGLASFVRNSIQIDEEGDVFVYKERDDKPHIDDSVNHGRNIQYLKLSINGKRLTIINFHGLWNGKGKTDTEDRLNQSRKIFEFASKTPGPKILCGDYNLLPDTESLKIIEDIGMKNLIKEFKITNTRTPLYPRAHLNSNFADYILVTPDIKVKEFKVLPDVVSDHAPLFLDFEVG